MDIAVTYETDWTAAHAIGVGILTAASLVWALVALPLAGWVFVENRSHRSPNRRSALGNWGRGIIWIAASLTAALTLLTAPGAIMRHLQHHPSVAWVVVPGLLIAGALAWFTLSSPIQQSAGFWSLIPAGLLTVGVLVGWGLDALTRAAASLPMSVGGLVLLLLGGLIWLILYARRA